MGSTIMAWVSGITGLVILVITYTIFMPMLNFMVETTVSLGAPAGIAFFLVKNAVWGYIILGIVCILYPVIYSWKQTYDQGRY